MTKSISMKISDPRPRINATLATDDDRTVAQITKGYVNIQRGTKTAILRMPYGEMKALSDLIASSMQVLEDNGYDTNAPLEEDEQPLAEADSNTDEAEVTVPDDASSLHEHAHA